MRRTLPLLLTTAALAAALTACGPAGREGDAAGAAGGTTAAGGAGGAGGPGGAGGAGGTGGAGRAGGVGVAGGPVVKAGSTAAAAPAFRGSIATGRDAVRTRVRYSWRRGCPVGPVELRLLRADYWGFDGRVHRGS